MASPRINPDGTKSMPILRKGSGVPLGYTGDAKEKELIKKARNLDKQQKKAQKRADRTGQPVRYGDTNTTGIARPKGYKPPQGDDVDPKSLLLGKSTPQKKPAPKSLREQRLAEREKRKAARVAKRTTRKAENVAERTARIAARRENINARRAAKGKAPRMFAAGGAVTKNAKGHNDYRKSGCTLSTVDNRKKKDIR